MCGRYSITTAPEAMRRLFGIKGALPNFPARYNVAPTQVVPVVRLDAEGRRELVLLRWGLVPSWLKSIDQRYSMINARAETVATKPAYRGSFRERRCLVPADGFYEWKAEAGGKQPYRFTLKDGGLFAFAGLWDRWRDPAGGTVESFTIIVTDPNELARAVHDRMPVILDPAAWESWLGSKSKTADLVALLQPLPAEAMAVARVSRRVNSPKNDDPSLILPIE
jgi:putative SOS response-associated peptidase YedK